MTWGSPEARQPVTLHRLTRLRRRSSRERPAAGQAVDGTRCDAMILLSAEVRDQLAAVAETLGISPHALMQKMAAQTLTPEQIRERGDRTRALLAERFGHYVTDEESAEMRRRMREAAVAHRAVLADASC